MSARVWQATIAAFLPALTVVGLARAATTDTDPLSSYVTSISAQLDPRVAQTVAQLVGTDRQLLALRSYLRSAPHLAERWSWTEEQIEAFEGSPEQRDLQQEIDRVRTAFVAANPGFELYVNSQVRSLDVQVEHWNTHRPLSERGKGTRGRQNQHEDAGGVHEEGQDHPSESLDDAGFASAASSRDTMPPGSGSVYAREDATTA